MNLRSLTRGDAAVAVGALLLLVSSFMPFYSFKQSSICGDECSMSAWSSGLLPILAGLFFAGIIGAVLILLARSRGEAAKGRQIAGLKLGQWGTALAVFSIWVGVWSLLSDGGGGDSVGHGAGAYIGFLAALLLGVGAIATPAVSALQAPLLRARPATPSVQRGETPWSAAGYPGAAQQSGYSDAQRQDGGSGEPQQGGAYGYSRGQQAEPAQQQWSSPKPGQAQPQAPSRGNQPAGGPAAVSAADFAPFWFAVPVARQLAPENNPSGLPVGELIPGTWYLAVEQRGTALVAQLQDGKRGLLADTSGIQRG